MDYESKESDKPKTSDGDDLLREARKRWCRGYEREQENIEHAYEDLKFRAGEQWPDEYERQRELEGRPCLTINRVPQFVRQVTGDMRQMKPAIKVVPVDDSGDPDTAETMGGMIRYIENRSDAQAAYFQAADNQVAAGIGAWRVLQEYADASTFEQELRIVGIRDPISVVWDPDAEEPTREDARFCFVPVDMSSDLFKEKYPDARAESFEFEDYEKFNDWYGEDYVRVAEYWYKKPIKRTLALMSDGSIEDLTDAPKEIVAEYAALGARIEKRDGHKICRALLSAGDVLEGPDEWPGRYIPIVPVLGEEINIGRRTVRHGLVRYAKDPQRMYNYFRSAQTEIVALQPKAPFIGTEKNFEQYQDVWETANTVNHPFLPYTPDPANGNIAPQRVPPPVSSQGVAEGVALAAEDMKAVTGIYDASLGARSNEQSGKAILARQQEGDTGTFVYIDNFARAIRYTGKILVDLIPHVYDTARTIRIMGDDGKVDLVQINQPVGLEIDGQPTSTVRNDVTVGSYDVVIEMGPSYNTRRQEAKDGMTTFLQSAPDVAPLMLDLVAEAQDWPNKAKVARRARFLLPPEVQAAEAEEAGETPPPSPQDMAAEQAGQLEMEKLRLEAQKLEVEKMKISADMQRTQVEALKAQLEALRFGVVLPPMGPEMEMGGAPMDQGAMPPAPMPPAAPQGMM